MALTGGLPGWDRPAVLTRLREAFGQSLVVENDVDAAALAERAHGHGQEVDSFAFVSVGTGIGMGLVIGGQLFRGAHGVAGEIAYMPMTGGHGADPEDARRRGVFEAAASAPAVVRAARRAGMRGQVSARRVFTAAARGDERAAAVVAEEAALVARVLCAVVTVVDPELIVLGGGVGQAPGFAAAVTAGAAADRAGHAGRAGQRPRHRRGRRRLPRRRRRSCLGPAHRQRPPGPMPSPALAAAGERRGRGDPVNGTLMAAEMAAQPEVLARVTARAAADTDAVRAVLPSPLAGVVFLARGSSDNAAVFGRYLVELRAGRPAGLAAPSLYTRYHATVDWHGYLVVALSQSGATPEIVSTCRAMRAGGAAVLGITNEPDSPLADAVGPAPVHRRRAGAGDPGHQDRHRPVRGAGHGDLGAARRRRCPTAPWTACPARWRRCSATRARRAGWPTAGRASTGWSWPAGGWPTPPRWRPRSR